MNLQRTEPGQAPRRRSTDMPMSPPMPVRPVAQASGGGQPVFRFDVRRSLQLHGKLALGIALAGLGLAIAFYLAIHPAYTAQALIFVQPAPPRVIEQSGSNSRWPNDPSEYESYMQQQVSTVTRHDVLVSALQKLDGDSWLRAGKTEQDEAERLGKALNVVRVGGSYQIAVNASADTAASSAHLANAVAASFVEFAHREERSGDTERLAMLHDERERIVNELAADRAEQETLNKQLGVAAIGTQTPDPYDEQMSEIRTELVKARTAHDEAAARLTSMNTGKATDAGKGATSAALDAEADELITTDAGLASMKSSLNQRRATIISQMANLTPNHPQYKQDAEELAQINTSLENMMKDLRAKAAARIQQRLRTDLDQTSGVESRLNGQLGQLTAAAAGATPKLQRSNDLATDILRLQHRFGVVDEQYRNQTIEDAAPGSVHLAASAEKPLHTSSSGRTRIALALMLAGVLFGISAAVTANKLDQRIYIPADVEQVLGFPPLGLLPDFAEVSESVAEEFVLRLAAAVDHARQTGNLKSCIFTGADGGAGVTTVVTRVRAMLGAIGRSTVLMDASSALPSISGMGSGSRGRRETDDIAGSLRGNRSTTMLQPMSERANEEAGEQAGGQVAEKGLVLTDAAPLLISAETEYLARFADAAIVVVESGTTTRDQLRAVATALERLNVAAVGFVLNRVGMEKATPEFRASVRAMEEHLDAQVQPASWRHESARPARTSFVGAYEDTRAESARYAAEVVTAPAAPATPAPAVTAAFQAEPVKASPESPSAAPVVAAEIPAQATAPVPVTPPAPVPTPAAVPAEKDRPRPRLPRVPLVEVATFVSTVADSDRTEIPAEKERVMQRARAIPQDEAPGRPMLVTPPDIPWWLVDPAVESEPQPAVAHAAPEVEAAAETQIFQSFEFVSSGSAAMHSESAEALTATENSASTAVSHASAHGSVLVEDAIAETRSAAPPQHRLEPESRFVAEEPVAEPTPVRIWEELTAVHSGGETQSATEEYLVRLEGDNALSLASRLNGLKSLFKVLGQKNLKNAVTAPAAGPAPQVVPAPQPEMLARAATVTVQPEQPTAPRSIAPAPLASTVATEAPIHVTAPPVILPPGPVAKPDEKQPQKQKGKTSNRDNWDDVDEVQILPSWRGQYRRNG
jgi:polysaccharide biosynthesis transport protein